MTREQFNQLNSRRAELLVRKVCDKNLTPEEDAELKRIARKLQKYLIGQETNFFCSAIAKVEGIC